jgi:hypothetical protein
MRFVRRREETVLQKKMKAIAKALMIQTTEVHIHLTRHFNASSNRSKIIYKDASLNKIYKNSFTLIQTISKLMFCLKPFHNPSKSSNHTSSRILTNSNKRSCRITTNQLVHFLTSCNKRSLPTKSHVKDSTNTW